MRKVGDKNKAPALVHITMRIPQWVYDHFYKVGEGSISRPIREVLERAVNRAQK